MLASQRGLGARFLCGRPVFHRGVTALPSVPEPPLPSPLAGGLRTGKVSKRKDPFASRKLQGKDGAFKGKDVVPMWIADMDFQAPEPVVEAVVECAQRGIFGYTNPPEELIELALKRLTDVYGCENPQKEWCGWLPGLVPGLSMSIRLVRDRYMMYKGSLDESFGGLTSFVGWAAHGVGIAVLTPAYPPFLNLPTFHGTSLERIPLAAKESDAGSGIIHFEIDWQLLEQTLAEESTHLLLLCNPHNPTGRCWPRDDLARLAKLCVDHDVVVCSDEVWGEMVMDTTGSPFTSMLTLIGESGVQGLSERLIVLTSPSKCFNVATLNVALTVVPDAHLRNEFAKAGGDKAEVTPFGYFATIACYGDEESKAWQQRLIAYIRGNRDYAVARLTEALPGLVKCTQPESSYLLWVDATEAMKLVDEEYGSTVGVGSHLLDHGVGASPGEDFGGGRTCFRLNLACARSTLELGLSRVVSALSPDQN